MLGGSFIGLGAWSVLQEYHETSNLVQVDTVLDAILHISLALIIVGMIIFMMSFAGCLGALRENLCLLKLVSIQWLLCVMKRLDSDSIDASIL